MMQNDVEKDQYDNYLENQFGSIFQHCGDQSPIKPLYADITNRQEILFMQFEMQKKGKKFGIVQNRLLKIEKGELYQVDRNQQQKHITFPNSIVISRKQDHPEEWEAKYDYYEAKILLKFIERSQITVYFRSMIQCNEVSMFLIAGMRQRSNKNIQNLANIYISALTVAIAKRIHQVKQSTIGIKSIKQKNKIIDCFKHHLSDKVYVCNLLNEWKSKAYFAPRQMSFLTLRILQINTRLDKIFGFVKIWVQGTISKQVVINSQNSTLKKYKNYNILQLNEEFIQRIDKIQSNDQIQIEFQINGHLLKTQRFTGNDLRKLIQSHRIIQLNLICKGQMSYLKFSAEFLGIQQVIQTPQITPKHYRVIEQLYGLNAKRLQLESIHKHYSQMLINGRFNLPFYTCFSKLKQLFQFLKIEEIIGKFALVETFKQYFSSNNKGTLIYQHFLKNYEKQLYYQVQKIIWKYQSKQFKPILTALRVFDQNPKLNFTQSYYYLIKRMHQIAKSQTINRWKDQLFARSMRGIESVTFFLTIGIIKAFPSIFIYQQFINKRALPFNSLLFVYVLQQQLPSIYLKINRIQLNIQAYFGCQFVNLLSRILQGQTFTRVLLLMLQQKKADDQSIYLFTVIGVFISLIEIVDRYNCSYLSAEHYIITFQELCRNIEDKNGFFTSVLAWRELAKQFSKNVQFQQMNEDITQFYLSNAYSGDLGQISSQIYQQFTCYHYKNQAQLRKVHLYFDKIDVGLEQQSHNLTLSIFQLAVKLYEHQFKGVNLNQIDHFIELKLVKLQEINIICNTDKYSYSCRFDPKEVPSNLYFHFVKPLILTYHLSPECNRHIFFQAYIKDSCEISSLQNPIPTKYQQLIFQNGMNKDTITFCKKFNKTFRMRQNNFNLLYSKLGWFGNHYLIPDERFINLQVLNSKRFGESELFNRIARINKYTRSIYGRAIIPYPSGQSRKLSVEIIKENIHTTFEPASQTLKSTQTINDLNIYNSASRLICYELDNFYISNSMQFLEFYFNMIQKLPLIQYLSYQPKLFYLLPSFTLQVSTHNSACTVIISKIGGLFITEFTNQQIRQIQQKASQFNRLPQQIQFSYTDSPILFDDFLFYLRLNILKKIILLNKKDNKQIKLKRWPNSLMSTSTYIPNYQLHSFYEVMNETRQIIHLQFKQAKRVGLKANYSDFGFIGGRWINVFCIAKLKTSTLAYYYVLTQLDRKKYLLKENDFIIVGVQERKIVNLSDDIANSMEVITYELNQMFEI